MANQKRAIDLWSVGVILLSIAAKAFPFFQSSNDEEALIEISILFGKAAMKQIAAKLGRSFETTLGSIGKAGLDQIKIRNDPYLFEMLNRLLELDEEKRITAGEALEHQFMAVRDDLL